MANRNGIASRTETEIREAWELEVLPRLKYPDQWEIVAVHDNGRVLAEFHAFPFATNKLKRNNSVAKQREGQWFQGASGSYLIPIDQSSDWIPDGKICRDPVIFVGHFYLWDGKEVVQYAGWDFKALAIAESAFEKWRETGCLGAVNQSWDDQQFRTVAQNVWENLRQPR